MANDNLRSGPEGATAQASKLGNRIIKLVEVDATAGSGGITHAANTAEAVLATVAGTVAHELVKADGPTAAYGFPGTYDQACFGGEWIVEKIWMQSTVSYATNPLANVTAGIYSLKGDGTVTAIDVDALCKAQAVTIAQQQFGMTHELVMDGDGVGLEYYKTAAPNSNTVSMKLGSGTAQFTDGDVDKTGEAQFLGIVVPDSNGNGKSVFYAEVKPVSGPDFKK